MFSPKSPVDVLDYSFDFSAFLPSGDAISTASVTVWPNDVTASNVGNVGKTVTFWLSGGTLDKRYTVTARIVTTQGRTAARSTTLDIVSL